MNIVVIGAGYAGMTAALRLDRRHRITLVTADEHFTQRIRLHELAAGRPSVTVPLAELTRGTGIVTVTARVSGLDPEAKLVRTADGRKIPYDTLVYALGSRTDVSTPGVTEHAYTAETAAELRARLDSRGGDLVVVGGGLTGVELAAELAEAYPAWRVGLVTETEPGAGLSARGRDHVAGTMARLGVSGHPGARVTAVEPDRLRTTRGDIPADVVVWAGAFTVPALAAEAGLAVDERGRARVDGTLRSVSHPDVYVVGDAAAVEIPGAGVSRMSCAVGMPIAAHAADVVNARAAGRTARPFRFRYLIQCVSLGRRDGVIQLVRRDDSPLDLILAGRTAAWVKEQVCRFTLGSLRVERRRPGTYLWPKGPAPADARARGGDEPPAPPLVPEATRRSGDR
ncbi:NAD(P)/FAD-dependent oxidoreductase [Streptosporangium sp. CA-135522]|uniref:NAD(P)/FAD-dependent oxidoreductase n=1 Tax=Streptosporangium sp. CA-135522 TaxID=3240072 RepID=UPI003D8EF856